MLETLDTPFSKTFIKREGNKERYARDIISNFPPHRCYIEPFLGAGGIFFSKKNAPYNFLNDLDSFIYKTYNYLINDFEGLLNALKSLILHESILKDKDFYKDDLMNTARIILQQITAFFGGETGSLIANISNKDRFLIEKLEFFKGFYLEKLAGVKIYNRDVFKFLDLITGDVYEDALIYCDPPYSHSKGRLSENAHWNFEKLTNLIDVLASKNCPFFVSEYDDPQVLELFKEKGLRVITISKSKGVGGRYKAGAKSEIMATNYYESDRLF